MTERTVFEHIRARLLAPRDAFADLERSEWSPVFERLMRNRLLMGAYRYGLLRDPGKPKYDTIGSIIARAQEYRRTGNLELLVDVANLALVEFVRPACHHNPTFSPADDGPHVERIEP